MTEPGRDIVLEAEHGWRAELRYIPHQPLHARIAKYSVVIIDPDGKTVESTDSMEESRARAWALERLKEHLTEYVGPRPQPLVEKVSVLKKK
jgi:hypothetical protein